MTELACEAETERADISKLVPQTSRKNFLSAIFVTALYPGWEAEGRAGGDLWLAAIPSSDIRALNVALLFEHIEAALYNKAAQSLRVSGYLAKVLTILKKDEEAHVSELAATIRAAGGSPVKAAPHYNFPNVFQHARDFLSYAVRVEDTGVGAYLGQRSVVKSSSVGRLISSITTVEGRHAGALRTILRRDPTQGPFDRALSLNEAVAAASALGVSPLMKP
jgi:rubrerythrin